MDKRDSELGRRGKEHCKGQRTAQKKNAWSFSKAGNEKALSIHRDTYGDLINQILLVSRDRKPNPVGLKERKGIHWLT